MADNMEEVNTGGKNAGNDTFAALLKFFGTDIASLYPETVQLPAFSTLSAMFTGACGLPEKLSLALVSRANVLRMIVKLAYI